MPRDSHRRQRRRSRLDRAAARAWPGRMRERVSALGGSITLASERGAGFQSRPLSPWRVRHREHGRMPQDQRAAGRRSRSGTRGYRRLLERDDSLIVIGEARRPQMPCAWMSNSARRHRAGHWIARSEWDRDSQANHRAQADACVLMFSMHRTGSMPLGQSAREPAAI